MNDLPGLPSGKAPAFLRNMKYQDINAALRGSDPAVLRVCMYLHERVKSQDEALQACAQTIDRLGDIVAGLSNVIGVHDEIARLVEGGSSMQDAIRKIRKPHLEEGMNSEEPQ